MYSFYSLEVEHTFREMIHLFSKILIIALIFFLVIYGVAIATVKSMHGSRLYLAQVLVFFTCVFVGVILYFLSEYYPEFTIFSWVGIISSLLSGVIIMVVLEFKKSPQDRFSNKRRM